MGRVFYGYGWESLLLEAGFLAVFPGGAGVEAPAVVTWLFRWLLFRILFGAGLIKLRGDDCWRDLTCLEYHYETQPLPNPLSWYLHRSPSWLHRLGVAFIHFVQLVVPFFYWYLVPGPVSWTAGAVTRERFEVVVEGTRAERPGDAAGWREHEFRGKPGDPARPPPVVAPYHWRLDWQMWFLLLAPGRWPPWVLAFVRRLLEGREAVRGLLAADPFGDDPPRWIRARLFRYEFTDPGERGESGRWWRRRPVGEYLPPVTLEEGSGGIRLRFR